MSGQVDSRGVGPQSTDLDNEILTRRGKDKDAASLLRILCRNRDLALHLALPKPENPDQHHIPTQHHHHTGPTKYSHSRAHPQSTVPWGPQ